MEADTRCSFFVAILSHHLDASVKVRADFRHPTLCVTLQQRFLAHFRYDAHAAADHRRLCLRATHSAQTGCEKNLAAKVTRTQVFPSRVQNCQLQTGSARGFRLKK